MTDFVAPLGIHLVEKGFADDFATSFYRLWRESSARLGGEDTPIVKMMPHLVMLDTVKDRNDSPDIKFVGQSSFCARVIPDTIGEDCPNPKEMIDPEFRFLVKDSYDAASVGEPCYDVIRSKYLLPEGPRRITYERLLLPFVTRTGKRWIFCYSIEKEVRSEAAERGHEYRNPVQTSHKDPGQLFSAEQTR